MRQTFVLILLLFLSNLEPVTAQDVQGPVRSTIIEKSNGKEYYVHTIKKGETLYKISKDYAIDMEEIITLNPEIKQGLKAGQVIRIPYIKPSKKEQPKPQPLPVTEQKSDSLSIAPPVPAPCGSDLSKKKKVYNIALMMHLFLNEIGTINTIPAEETQEGIDEAYRPLQFIQFYEGFMLAVDSLEKQGLSVRIHVFDIDTDTTETKKFLREPGLDRMDMIIALLYHRNFEIVAGFAMKHQIPVVSPISERDSQVENNPWVFKVKPTPAAQDEQVADFLAREYRGSRVVIIRSSLTHVREAAENLWEKCSDKGLDVVLADGAAGIDQLVKERSNLVVIISENKTYVLNLLTQLNAVKDQYEVTALGLPRWDRFEDLDYDYLSRLQTHVVSPVFIDYSTVAVQRFVRLFQQKYSTAPDILAFTGHDVAIYFLTALMRYGTAFPGCLAEIDEPLYTGSFKMIKRPDGGYENNHWNIFFYSNFEVYKAEDR